MFHKYLVHKNNFSFTLFSLGPKVAKIYNQCEVNTSRIKNSTQIDMNLISRKMRGCYITEEVMDQCCHISKFIGTVCLLQKMLHLRQCITFIKDFLNSFVNPLGLYPFNTFGTTEYYPLLLKLHSEEISNYLYDIYEMAKGLMFFLHSINYNDIVNKAVHVLYTFNYYFTSIIESNWEFAPNKYKPQTMWKVC